MPTAIIVHGGAGQVESDRLEEHIKGVEEAARVGRKLLLAGNSALEAVERAVMVLEDHPAYDAGKGSVLTSTGEIEVDAMIMDGHTLQMGAVASVKGVTNPIQLARLVMQNTNHNLLVGEGARDFARSQGIPLVAQAELMVPHEIERYRRYRESPPGSPPVTGTVGAVALDSEGNIAAATSTGGTAYKLPGRVGDTPMIGCGTYADNEVGGASSTGQGERIMEVMLAKHATDLMRSGSHPQKAAETSIQYLERRVNGFGGIILVGMKGEIGFAHSTLYMPVAWYDDDGNLRSYITPEL